MQGTDPRTRIVAAAIETVRQHGLAGASARAIAKTGGFNQALIYYYFADLTDLYVAALDHSSAARMSAYRARLDEIGTPEDLVRVARELFAEDVATGHITVVSELVAGALSHPELGPRVAERTEPWIGLAEGMLDRFVRGSPVERMLPSPRQLAEALVAFYLGIDMLYHLDSDHARADALFEVFSRLLPLLAPFLNRTPAIDRDLDPADERSSLGSAPRRARTRTSDTASSD